MEKTGEGSNNLIRRHTIDNATPALQETTQEQAATIIQVAQPPIRRTSQEHSVEAQWQRAVPLPGAPALGLLALMPRRSSENLDVSVQQPFTAKPPKPAPKSGTPSSQSSRLPLPPPRHASDPTTSGTTGSGTPAKPPRAVERRLSSHTPSPSVNWEQSVLKRSSNGETSPPCESKAGEPGDEVVKKETQKLRFERVKEFGAAVVQAVKGKKQAAVPDAETVVEKAMQDELDIYTRLAGIVLIDLLKMESAEVLNKGKVASLISGLNQGYTLVKKRFQEVPNCEAQTQISRERETLFLYVAHLKQVTNSLNAIVTRFEDQKEWASQLLKPCIDQFLSDREVLEKKITATGNLQDLAVCQNLKTDALNAFREEGPLLTIQ